MFRLFIVAMLFTLSIPAQAQHNTPTPLFVGGGSLTRNDFVERAKRTFGTMDVRRKGFLTERQVAHLFPDPSNSSGSVRVPFPVRPVFFSQIDLNKDGKITLSEYLKYASRFYAELKHS